MKVNRATGAVMLAAGALTVLGFAGTAFADGSDDPRPRAAVTATPPTDDATPQETSDDTFGSTVDDSSSPSPDDSSSPSPDDSTSPWPDDSGSPSPDSSSSTFPDDAATRSPGSSASPSSSASSSPSAASRTRITAEQAKTIALRAAGGGRIESIEREHEHGRLVWDIDVILKGTEHDIDVDATTGEVTRHRTDNDDNRGRGGDDKHDDRGDRDDDRGRDSDD